MKHNDIMARSAHPPAHILNYLEVTMQDQKPDNCLEWPNIDTKSEKSSRTCLVGYSGFISHEWFVIAWGRSNMHAHVYTQDKNDCGLKYNYSRGSFLFSAQIEKL